MTEFSDTEKLSLISQIQCGTGHLIRLVNPGKAYWFCLRKRDHTHKTRASFTIPKYKVSVIVEGKPNQLYAQGMRSFEQYDEARKYFAEGKQRDNDANEIQKHLQLYNLSLGEYLVNKYALWLDFRMIDENELQGMGRRIENASEAVTLQIEKKKESAGALNAYIYLIMNAQLNIQNGAYVSAVY